MTALIARFTGIARDDEALREKTRCVINSEWMKRG
jgi:hypothetical protein